MKTEKEEALLEQLEEVKVVVDMKLRRNIELAGEKGAGAWLSLLPIQSLRNDMNKQDFNDAPGTTGRVPGTPAYCSCGAKNSVDHILICKLGGYITMRHNNIRDFTATLLREVCKDVKVEPMLLPVGNTDTQSSNQAEKARLDVSAVGIWSPMERTFLDVRVVHINSPSYMDRTPEQIYTQNDRDKKRTYNHRILEVEKGSFTPLVFSTTGGMGPECTRFFKRIAELISVKRGEAYSDVMNYIRTRIRTKIYTDSGSWRKR